MTPIPPLNFNVGRLSIVSPSSQGDLAMSARTVVEAYFDAFNNHDSEAIAELFAKGGRYIDSAVSSGVEGESLKEYLKGHYAAFPDASYQILRTVADSDGLAACEWIFKGTNTGPLGNSPATNRRVEVTGASILQISGDKIGWLHGYYDRRHLLRQLGM
jgi:steroid delta-isomerase-like uncharacterized protein